jgi:hypothetical protein
MTLSTVLLLTSALAAPAPDLSLAVSAAYPVRGRPLAVAVTSGQAVTVTASQGPTACWSATVTPDADCHAVVDWTPAVLGPVTITAHAGTVAASREVFVTPRPLHFNYWSSGPEQRVITSKLLARGENPAALRARGVQPLAWKYGSENPSFHTAEQWTKDFGTSLSGCAGVMIDELGGGGAQDQIVGRALVAARQQWPDLFLAPYCVGLGGADMIAGFKASDVVLVESYCNDWRGYGGLDSRLKPLAPVADKAIAVLGLGGWTTTEVEVRQQVSYLRVKLPDMPGIGFFEGGPAYLMAAIDRILTEQFLRPALLLTQHHGTATVRNVGCLPARDVTLKIGGSQAPLATIEPGAQVIATVPAGVTAALVPGDYTILSYRSPTDLPPPDAAATAAARAWRARFADAGPPQGELRLTHRAKAGAPKNAPQDQVDGAELDLPGGAAPVAGLAATVQVGRAWFYGAGEVGLKGQGKGQMGFGWTHSDGDGDVPGGQPRVTFRYRGPRGERTEQTFPPSLVPHRSYELVCGQSAPGTVRAQLWTADGQLLWDTGDLPCEEQLQPAAVRLGVSPSPASSVTRTTPVQPLQLHGVAGDPYVLDSTVGPLRLLAVAGAV